MSQEKKVEKDYVENDKQNGKGKTKRVPCGNDNKKGKTTEGRRAGFWFLLFFWRVWAT